MTTAVRNLIKEDKPAQMYSQMQTGSSLGMQTMEQAIQALERKGTIEPQKKTSSRSYFLETL